LIFLARASAVVRSDKELLEGGSSKVKAFPVESSKTNSTTKKVKKFTDRGLSRDMTNTTDNTDFLDADKSPVF